jgi:type I restriction enzyme S subunit
MNFSKWQFHPEIGEVPSDWIVRPFKNLIFYQEGPGLRRFQFTESGMKVLNVTNIIGQGEVDMTITDRYISLDEYNKKYKHFTVEDDDIVIASSGNTIGKIGRIKHYNLPTILNTSTIRFNNKLNPQEIDQNYLYYFLQSQIFQNQLISHSSGSAQPNVGPTHISRMFISYPKIQVQRRIGSILRSLDEMIEANRQINQTLEAIAQTTFKEWFMDFNYPDTTGEMQESEIGNIPKGWRVEKLKNFVALNPSLRLKKHCVAKYVEMKDLSETSMSINRFIEREFSSGSRFQNGDTLFARITPCLENGKTGFVDFLEEQEVGWGSTEFIVLRGKKLSPYFVYCLSRLPKFRNFAIQSMVGSSGRQRVVESILSDFQVVVPNSNMSDLFAKLVKPLFTCIKSNHEQIQTLSRLRDSLLPKLMRGELIINQES